MGYAPAGMRFNSVSTRHMSDTFHVCYEVMSVNTAEPRCAMRDSDRRNTGKSVDRGSVTERSVAGAAERSDIRKNKGKIAISSHNSGSLSGQMLPGSYILPPSAPLRILSVWVGSSGLAKARWLQISDHIMRLIHQW